MKWMINCALLACFAVLLPGVGSGAEVSSQDEGPGKILTGELVPKEKKHDKEIYITPGEGQPRGLLINRKYIEEQNAIATGVGFGFELGYWGTGLEMGLVTKIPVDKKKLFGLRLRLFVPMGPDFSSDIDPMINFEFGFYRNSPIFFGVFRLSAGGGFYAGMRPRTFPAPHNENAISEGAHADTKEICSNTFVDKKGCRFGFSGGGWIGIELFPGASHAVFINVGGQGYVHPYKTDAAAHVLIGEIFYFGKVEGVKER